MYSDVVIIGNGILGLSTALSLVLKDPNLKISIIGKECRNGSAGVAAGAMLNSIGEVTSETLKNPFSKKKLEFCLEASKRWDGWIEIINSDLSLEEKIKIDQGTYIILNSKSGSLDTDNFNAIIEASKIYKQNYEEILPSHVKGINPIDNARPLRALYLPDEGSVDSNMLFDGLVKKLSSFSNINFINHHVVKVNSSEYNIESVELDNGEVVSSSGFILCAGSYSQKFIDQLPQISSLIPRILAGVGLSAIVSQVSENKIKNVIRTPNRSGACGLHVLPRVNNQLYIGATNNLSFAPMTQQKLGLTQFLLQCAIDQIDQDLYTSEIISWTVGNRPVTIDAFPLIGETSINNLFILTGTYRDGIHQSPLLADMISDLVLNNKSNFDNPFKPERDLIKASSSKEQSIDNVVEHYIAGFYEHDMKLARLFPERNLSSMLKIKFEEIYNQLGTNYPMCPDLLFLFELSDSNQENINFFREYFKNRNC